MVLEEAGRSDPDDPALALGRPVAEPGVKWWTAAAKAIDSSISPIVRIHRSPMRPCIISSEAHAGEEQQRENALADREEEPVRHERPGAAAEVARGRVREDGVARPVRRVKAGEAQQQEEPQAGGDEQEERYGGGWNAWNW